MAGVSKTIPFGTCKDCGSMAYKKMTVMENPATHRGITLVGTGPTGYWIACSNPECENHEGVGTLDGRPRDLP